MRMLSKYTVDELKDIIHHWRGLLRTLFRSSSWYKASGFSGEYSKYSDSLILFGCQKNPWELDSVQHLPLQPLDLIIVRGIYLYVYVHWGTISVYQSLCSAYCHSLHDDLRMICHENVAFWLSGYTQFSYNEQMSCHVMNV